MLITKATRVIGFNIQLDVLTEESKEGSLESDPWPCCNDEQQGDDMERYQSLDTWVSPVNLRILFLNMSLQIVNAYMS